jgi:hypothetical protein
VQCVVCTVLRVDRVPGICGRARARARAQEEAGVELEDLALTQQHGFLASFWGRFIQF